MYFSVASLTGLASWLLACELHKWTRLFPLALYIWCGGPAQSIDGIGVSVVGYIESRTIRANP
jgi:hypothetical protein